MPKEFIEMKIPVPYGRIMAKAWGNSDSHSHKVLAIHGWQDNAGTFDTLVPLLPESLYILAVDLPGHGLSSHLPPGCPYTDIMFLIEVKRIVDYMEWNEFTILGHSMGGMIGLLYSSLYPQSVTKVILLDTIKSFCYPWDKWPQKVADITKVFVQMDQKNSIPPVYDHKTMIERMKSSTAIYKDINEEAIECLLSRGSKVSSDGKGEYFSRDIRTKLIFVQQFSCESLLDFYASMKCDLIIIIAKNGLKISSEEVNDKVIEFYRKKCRTFKFIQVDGHHHVHLTQPQTVSPFIINEFI